MKVERFSPSVALLPFIREYIIIETDEEFDSKAIPDTSIVMAFRYKGAVQRMEGEGKEALAAAVISGIRKSVRLFHYTHQTANLLVVLNEAGIAAFSRIPAHELFGHSISSENLFLSSELDGVIERLAEAKMHGHRIRIMEIFLLEKLMPKRPDPLINHAIQLIKQQNGIVRIKELAGSLHISQDPFEKRFRTLVGATPKQYASIVRLKHLIQKYPSYTSLTDASYEAGYFDQSHFIKDFRLFTGQAPKDFFKSSRYW